MSSKVVEVTWAPSGVVGVVASVGLHRLLIVGPWLAPKGSCEGSTCEDLASKVVPRSVEGLQALNSGPMDPRPLHHDH